MLNEEEQVPDAQVLRDLHCRRIFTHLLAVFVKQSWVDSASLNDPRATARGISPRGDLAPEEKSTIALFRQASPSVVNITAISVQRDLFTLNHYQIPEGTGSGFIWDTQRKYHYQFSRDSKCRRRASDLGGSANMEGALVGVAPDKDIAVLTHRCAGESAAADSDRHIEGPAGGPKCFRYR